MGSQVKYGGTFKGAFTIHGGQEVAFSPGVGSVGEYAAQSVSRVAVALFPKPISSQYWPAASGEDPKNGGPGSL